MIRALLTTLRETFRALADRAAAAVGYVPDRQVRPAVETLRNLSQYADRSGHLSNGYNAGQRVKADVGDALAALRGARALLPPPSAA